MESNAYGIKNSPTAFQRIIDKVLEWEMGKNSFVYINDILIYAESEEEHDKTFIRVCDKLSESGFQANEDKLEFKKEEVVFLGHTISCNEIKSHLDLTEGFEDYKKPKNADVIKRFLGFVSHYRKLIPNCAQSQSH